MNKKIFLLFCGLFLLLVAGPAGVAFYYYTHPDALKPFVEKSLSDVVGTRCTTRKLSYSINPLKAI